MLYIVSDPSKLQKYQDLFMRELERARPKEISCIISWRPENLKAEVNWLADVGIWYYSEEMNNKWWNVFGISEPAVGESVGIACEINIPKSGINRNVAGGFAEDGGRVFVIHRGNRYGGGKLGMTKAHFWRRYSGGRQYAVDGDNPTEVAVIGELRSPRLPADVARFVSWMVGLKAE